LIAAIKWIKRSNPTAARGLRQAVSTAAISIGDHHAIGEVRIELANEAYRFLPVAGFPYILVYTAISTPPRIIRILHGARDLPEALSDL
jgi:plasmid stabilization system protein ParE